MKRIGVLDAPGGIAGDMFQAAMLDAFPELENDWRGDLGAAGLLDIVTPEITKVRKNGFAARQLDIAVKDGPPELRHWRDIRDWLRESALDPAVRDRAISIFEGLARAEAASHAVEIDAVHFHEVSDWDSMADIVGAASLITRSGIERWSTGPLPMGSGFVETQHGRISVPAPAVTHLLKGFELYRDATDGERITPTGAAIVAHLVNTGCTERPTGRLVAGGCGAGHRDLSPINNVLNIAVLEGNARSEELVPDRVARISFEIDDMTPEELGVALDTIRECSGVLDASFILRYGKKGRPQFGIDILARTETENAVVETCFTETSTLGLRVSREDRLTLPRTEERRDGVRIKTARRPGGATAKAESDDLAGHAGLTLRRARARKAEADET